MASKTNPNCPVIGCRTPRPHSDDPIVRSLIAEFAPPEKMTYWACAALVDLKESLCRDLRDDRLFAWYSRLRLPEEIYIRTLYALFIATNDELIHILSGATPNGLSPLYAKVNEKIFEDRGLMQVSQPGLNQGSFKPIDILHDGAHGSFRAILTCIGLTRDRTNLPSPERQTEHLQKYCAYLEYMHGMFKAGKDKKHVLAGVISAHRPASHWQQNKS
jgi:hypothetical protein